MGHKPAKSIESASGLRVRGLLGAAAVAALLAGCSPMVHTDGQIPDETKLATIQPGVQTADEVRKLIGTPSTEAVYGQKTWYYITKRTSQIAFFTPSIEDEKVIEISFDDSGKVSEIRQYGMDDAKNVSPVARETPTKGKHLTVLDQMLGNLNRYGAAAPGRTGPGGPSPSPGGGGY
jgi:outer membrane protein assembly factor BamE (lipoprotein component of BamABCDE complex)